MIKKLLFVIILGSVLCILGCNDNKHDVATNDNGVMVHRGILSSVTKTYLITNQNDKYKMADVIFVGQSGFSMVEFKNIPVAFEQPLYYGAIYKMYLKGSLYTLIKEDR